MQLTYLNPENGEKIAGLSVPKRTIGSLQGAFVQINPPKDEAKISFVGEGIETALSIKNTLSDIGQPDYQVLASLGKSNLNMLGQIDTENHVVLVLDNDREDWRKDKTISAAISNLEKAGKQVFCMQPESINNDKTDYNDLAQAGKSSLIESDLQGAVKYFEKRVNIRSSPKQTKIAEKEIF